MSLATAIRPPDVPTQDHPTLADLHAAVLTADCDQGSRRWARLLAAAGVTGRESDPPDTVYRVIATMLTSSDPILARCGYTQYDRLASR